MIFILIFFYIHSTSCIGCSGEICLSLSKDAAYYFVSKFVDHDKHKIIAVSLFFNFLHNNF